MSPRYSKTRQKSCQQCSVAKARCDRNPGGCTRCKARSLSCDYLRESSSSVHSKRKASAELDHSPSFQSSCVLTAFDDTLVASNLEVSHTTTVDYGEGTDTAPQSSGTERPMHATLPTSEFNLGPDVRPGVRSYLAEPAESLDFRDLELTCPINAHDISNRWLNTYIPIPGQATKSYHPTISSFISRILGSYVSTVIRGHALPPFVHPAQLKSDATCQSLSVCFSLAKICGESLPGTHAVVTRILQQEMNKLYEQHHNYDGVTLLAAFQAYLLYAMMLYFRISPQSDPYLRQAVMRCQEFACASSQQGLVCLAEEEVIRPKWEAWIVVEAKRRTLYTMYMFDNVLSTQDDLPIFLGTELQGLPAPAGRSLWQATARDTWQKRYNTHLAAWQGVGLKIDELWPMPPNLTATEVAQRRSRIDHWLENVDDFGTMLYAVTSCTHGS